MRGGVKLSIGGIPSITGSRAGVISSESVGILPRGVLGDIGDIGIVVVVGVIPTSSGVFPSTTFVTALG